MKVAKLGSSRSHARGERQLASRNDPLALAGVIGVVDPAAPLWHSRWRSCGGNAISILDRAFGLRQLAQVVRGNELQFSQGFDP
jgi:hypothetical protein